MELTSGGIYRSNFCMIVKFTGEAEFNRGERYVILRGGIYRGLNLLGELNSRGLKLSLSEIYKINLMRRR